MSDSTQDGGTKRKRKGDPTESELKAWAESHKFRFVNMHTTDDEKERIKDGSTTHERICEFLLDAVSSDYKVSINWDKKHHCAVVSITDQQFWRDTYNACVTSRGPDIWIALAMAIYKWDKIISISGIPNVKPGDKEVFD